MAFQTGVGRRLYILKESTFGTKPAAGGASRELNRVSSTLALMKENYGSRSIATHGQISDNRHGPRRVEGSISGELQAGQFTELWAALLRGTWASGLTTTSATTTVTPGTNTISRSAGSYLSDGLRVGDVVRSANLVGSGNANKNIRVTSVTALSFTYGPDVTLSAEAATAGVTFSVQGKKLVAPSSSQTDDSFTVEHWNSDVSISHRFVGWKPTGARLRLSPTGIVEVEFPGLGKDREKAGTVYFSAPSAASTDPIFTSAVGVARAGSNDVAVINSMDLTISGNHQAAQVAFASSAPAIFKGRLAVEGTATLYFADATFDDAFDLETEMPLYLTMYSSGLANADLFVLKMPRVKVLSFTTNDVEQGVLATVGFQSLLPATAGDIDVASITLQDSKAV